MGRRVRVDKDLEFTALDHGVAVALFVEGETVRKAGAAHTLDKDPELLAFGLGHPCRKLIDLFNGLFGKRNHCASCVSRLCNGFCIISHYIAI